MSEVRLKFTGDTSDLEKGLGRVEDDLDAVGKSMGNAEDKAKRFSRSSDDMADSLEGGAGKLRSTNDLIQGFADTTGLALPPQAMMIMGVADMADGMAGALLPALGKVKDGMKAMNAVMRANPILSVITIVTLLVGALVLAYQKSETFRKVVDATWSGIKKAASAAWDFVKPIFTNFIEYIMRVWQAGQKMADILGKAFSGVKETVKGAINWIIDKVNTFIDAANSVKNSKVAAVFSFGQADDVPDIPRLNHFANGGVMAPGLAMVGERGPELFAAPQGGRVFSRGETQNMLNSGNGSTTIQVVVDGRVVTESVYSGLLKKKRTQGTLGLA